MKKYQASKITFESTRPYMTGHYEDGKEDGRQEERHETAMNALKKGLSLKTISDITSLSISEIEKLKNQI